MSWRTNLIGPFGVFLTLKMQSKRFEMFTALCFSGFSRLYSLFVHYTLPVGLGVLLQSHDVTCDQSDGWIVTAFYPATSCLAPHRSWPPQATPFPRSSHFFVIPAEATIFEAIPHQRSIIVYGNLHCPSYLYPKNRFRAIDLLSIFTQDQRWRLSMITNRVYECLFLKVLFCDTRDIFRCVLSAARVRQRNWKADTRFRRTRLIFREKSKILRIRRRKQNTERGSCRSRNIEPLRRKKDAQKYFTNSTVDTSSY